jgi:general stress protein YciG
MAPERRRDISRKGGVAAHRKGTAHEWDTAAARDAGRKGALAHRNKPRVVPEDQPEPPANPQSAAREDPRPQARGEDIVAPLGGRAR